MLGQHPKQMARLKVMSRQEVDSVNEKKAQHEKMGSCKGEKKMKMKMKKLKKRQEKEVIE
jgi:hypothetical protein